MIKGLTESQAAALLAYAKHPTAKLRTLQVATMIAVEDVDITIRGIMSIKSCSYRTASRILNALKNDGDLDGLQSPTRAGDKNDS